ncbi:MAG: RagB/SusD family nutrient uptake outer membrane protein [Odoribacter splanchnicus]
MKKILILTPVISLLFFFTSCSNWLDVPPKTSINEEDLYAHEYGFKDVLTGFYLKLGDPSLYGKQFTYNFMEFLAQRYENKMIIDNELYNYSGSYKTIVENYYSMIYKVIANINNFLYYIDANRDVIKTPDYYEVMKGEALGYADSCILNCCAYSDRYIHKVRNKMSAYCTRLDAEATPLLPASQFIDLVIADLHEAEKLLEEHDPKEFSSDYGNETRDPFMVYRQTRMNIYAVYAILARAYLYKGDADSKSRAYNYASDVINSGYFSLAGSNSNRILFQEHIFNLYIDELDKIVDEDFKNISSSNMSEKPETLDKLYEFENGGATDFRLNNNSFELVNTVKVSRKFDQQGYDDPLRSGGKNSMPLIRLPEMYYILAECATDPTEAADWLNTVRANRGIPADVDLVGDDAFDQLDSRPGCDNTQTKRINEIMKEYNKEYYGEGQLFYFYKRLNYKVFTGCPAGGMLPQYYTPAIPDNEHIFGNNN